MGNLDRRATTLERTEQQRSSGSRLAGLGDRLARTFSVTERPEPDWEPARPPFDDEQWDGLMPRFPVVRSGYDCVAVDEHISELERELADLEREIAELRISAKPRHDVEAEIQRIGEQTSSILLAAHDKARETTEQAQAEADRCLADAAANAVKMTEEANRSLRQLESDKTALADERGQLLDDMRKVAGALSSLADDAARRFPAEPASEPH
jgi:DivIVA protein